MMRNFYLIPLIIISVMFGFAAQADSSPKKTSPKKPTTTTFEEIGLHKRLIDAKVTSAATLDINGEAAKLWGAGNFVLFQSGKNKPIVIAKDKVTDKGVWLHKNKKRLYALWWVKLKEGKQLKVKTSLDNGKTFTKDAAYITKFGVLPEVKITDDGEDKIAVAYISEREPGYQVYFNRSLDGGKTWFDKDVRMNELYNKKGPVAGSAPLKDEQGVSQASAVHLQYIDEKLVLTWQEGSVFEGTGYMRIVSKISKDDGKTWGKEIEIYRQQNLQPQEMHTNLIDGELFISVFIPKKGLLTFTSMDKASKWKQLETVPDTKDLVYASYMTSTFSSGSRFLTYTSKLEKGKDAIKVVVNEPNKESWIDITTKVIANSKFTAKDEINVTKTTLSSIGSLNDTVLVVWQEHKFLLPTLYVNYSNDGGKTWLENPMLLAAPGKVMLKYPSLHQDKSSIWLHYTYMDYSTKGFKQGLYGSKTAELNDQNKVKLNFPPQENLIKKITEEEKIKRLRQRSKDFWALRVNEKYGDLLDYFDPIYRSSYTKKSFARTQGQVQFLDAKTDKVTVDGNLGFVTTSLKVVLAMLTKGDLIDEATIPTPKDIDARWGWFYDDWYVMPHTLFKRDFDY